MLFFFFFLFFLSHLKSSHDWSILPSLWNYHAQLGLLQDLKKSKPMNEPSNLVFRTVNLWFLTSTWQQAHVDERKWIGIVKTMMTFYLIILLLFWSRTFLVLLWGCRRPRGFPMDTTLFWLFTATTLKLGRLSADLATYTTHLLLHTIPPMLYPLSNQNT